MLNKITPPPMPVLIEDLGMHYATKNSKKKRRYGLYKCSCGKEFRTEISSIKNGNTNSCGCYHIKISIELKTTHGMINHKIYPVWQQIISRTTNVKHKSFKDYGQRGIKVCERWLHSFENFRDDMLPTWEEGLTIDRIYVNGNYEPSNCRWAKRTIQSRNTRLIHSNNKSGYRGVCFDKSRKKWFSQITINSKSIKLGRFNTALEAAIAYDRYVVQHNFEHTINGVLFSSVAL